MPSEMKCYLVEKNAEGGVRGAIAQRPLDALPAGDVLIRVAWSSLNYKDALAAEGHPGVARQFPHVPGIDVAGTVAESSSPDFSAGQEVITTGHELGVERWGGWAEYVRVPADWVLPLPEGLSLREAMILGTAGFTAVQSVDALQQHGLPPDAGEVVVTGATGGVGSLSVQILAKRGYRVVAVTGKRDRHAWLKEIGATRVVPREETDEDPSRPLLSARWAGAVDTVGGMILSTLLRSVRHRGCVAACGLAAGAELPLTVHPFILRGVTLAGIDSAWCPDPRRREIWRRLAGADKPDRLNAVATEISLDDLPEAISRIRRGGMVGRTIVGLNRGAISGKTENG